MRRLAVALLLTVAALPAPARADWEVKRSPFDARVVARYKQLLHGNPDDADALARLTALYKQYKNLTQLERELTATAEKSGEVNDWLAVGNVLRARGDAAGAAKAYAAAVDKKGDDARALAALADADVQLGKNGEARPVYERALAATSDGKKKRPLLKKLVDLALLNDRGLDAKAALAEARTYHDELVKLDPRDDDARREWAEALAAHGQPGEAAAEWRTLAVGLSRDPARQGQAWLRAGELAEAAGDDKEARAAYDKTWALAPKGNYLRRESADKIVGLARKHDTLRTLTGEWERAWPEGGRGFTEWELLGRLYDELGDAEKAQGDFKRALALDPHALDARRRLIALYERTGRDAEALAEVRRLIASAPGEARFRLELAERLMKAGSRDEALKVAQAVGRESTDPSLHAQLAELYSRWNLADPAMREQELLVRLEPADDSHLVALGELWWQKGNKKRALELWKRILVSGSARTEGRGPKVAAMARLAEVYVEHDMAPEALDLFQKAAKLSPDDVTVQKGIGSTLERLHRDAEAQDIWEGLFSRAAAKHDRAAQLEARQRLLVIAQRGGRLGIVAGQYRDAAMRARHTDEEEAAAYTLIAADALVKMGRTEMAEELLHGLADTARSRALRADAWMGLAQVERARHKLVDALAALKKAAELMPERGHELYPQIAELSLQLYQDADALSYARRAVQLGPADAAATVRLGEVLEKREDLVGAAQAYERALELDDRQWKVYFTLARLRIRSGGEARAAELYRTVMRRAPDEELVIDAARRAIDLEEYLGTLGELERELSPLAYAHADKPVYRNLLIELYDRYGTPLVARAQAPGNDGESVRPELQRLGEHGLRPLLDVLVDGEAHELRVAVTLLGAIGNPSAAPALFKLALNHKVREHEDRTGAFELRELGALAAAEVATAKELPLLQKVFAEPEKQLRVAAAYGYGRLADKRAVAQLVAALDDGAVDVQAMACLALGAHADGRALDAMVTHLRPSETRKPETRMACAYGLGAAAIRTTAPLTPTERAVVRAALAATLGEGADEVQRAAAWALGAVGGDEARPPLVRAVFVKRDDVRRTAELALSRRSLLGTGATRALPPPVRGDDGLDLRATLTALGRLAATAAPGESAPPLVDSAADSAAVADAVNDALARHRDVITRTLDDLVAAGNESEAALWPRVAPAVRALATHADPAVRARVAKLAARVDDVELLAGALADKARPVRLAALDAIAAAPAFARPSRTQLTAELERALRSTDWLERRAAVLAAVPHPELWPDKGARALAPLRHDPSGFVRQAVR